jgi:hypothetical protein
MELDADLRTRAEGDFNRLQLRRVDALQFKLQREIRLRSDEISRLKSELAFLRGRAEALPDTTDRSQQPLQSHCATLRHKAFHARTNYELKYSALNKQHQETLYEIEKGHQAEVRRLRTQLDAVLEPIPPPQIDEVDAFLSSVRAPNRNCSKHLPTPSEPDRLEEENRAAEDLVADLKAKVRTARKKLKARQVSESAEKAELAILEAERATETERAHEMEEAIAAARLEAAALNEKGEKLERASKSQTRLRLKPPLDQLTPTEKQARIVTLRRDNNRLKKEIARVDFMIYGKAGQYQMWK